MTAAEVIRCLLQAVPWRPVSWRERAACVGLPAEWFFAERPWASGEPASCPGGVRFLPGAL